MQARDAGEVAEAVVYAVQHDLVLSVRSGGHSGPGFGTNDDGIVIDVSMINDVSVVDEATSRVRIGAGAQWGDVADALGKVGLSLTSGDTKSVGVGGLTQGGGVGWMVRNHGLTIDSLVAAEIVTADGQQLRVDADHASGSVLGDPWGRRQLRGRHALRVHRTAGDRCARRHDHVRRRRRRRLIKGWSKVMREAPEELNATLVLMPGFGPDMPAGGMNLVCYAGDDAAAAEAAFAPLHEVATGRQRGDRGQALRRRARGGAPAAGTARDRQQHDGADR